METPVSEGGNSEDDSVFNTKPVKEAQMETSAVPLLHTKNETSRSVQHALQLREQRLSIPTEREQA